MRGVNGGNQDEKPCVFFSFSFFFFFFFSFSCQLNVEYDMAPIQHSFR